MYHTEYCSSTTTITDHVIEVSAATLEETLASRSRAERIDQLGRLASSLEIFVRGYERIEGEDISTDDEILNWTFGEVPIDLAAAVWLLASGFYKASASCLRNAYDIAMAALYFQIRENENKDPGYNRIFSEWDTGARGTPNWGEMKAHVAKQKTVVDFIAATGIDPVALAYQHFKYLCAYTHTAAYAGVDDPVTAINMTGVAPAYEEQFFNRGAELATRTMSMIAVLWQVVFPAIAKTEPLGPLSSSAYGLLFSGPLGSAALGR